MLLELNVLPHHFIRCGTTTTRSWFGCVFFLKLPVWKIYFIFLLLKIQSLVAHWKEHDALIATETIKLQQKLPLFCCYAPDGSIFGESAKLFKSVQDADSWELMQIENPHSGIWCAPLCTPRRARHMAIYALCKAKMDFILPAGPSVPASTLKLRSLCPNQILWGWGSLVTFGLWQCLPRVVSPQTQKLIKAWDLDKGDEPFPKGPELGWKKFKR